MLFFKIESKNLSFFEKLERLIYQKNKYKKEYRIIAIGYKENNKDRFFCNFFI